MMTINRKKILKITGYTLLLVLVLLLIGGAIGIQKFNHSLFKDKPNYLVFTSESKPMHFDWGNDTIAGYYETLTAMTIPVKMEGLAHNLYMQFDTGAHTTVIYERQLKSLKAAGLKFAEVIKEDGRYIKDLNFNLGGSSINASMIKILENYGTKFNPEDTVSRMGIGTIGSDFMVNRIMAIDFKNQKISLMDKRPAWMLSLSGFKSFDFSGRRVMLPVLLDQKKYEYLYDSGASSFGLITTKNRFENYTDNSVEEIKYDAKSWDSSMPMRSKSTDKLFEIGGANLKLMRVTYVDMYTSIQKLMTPFTRIGGWLGNRPFTEHTMIIDAQKEEFIIIKSAMTN